MFSFSSSSIFKAVVLKYSSIIPMYEPPQEQFVFFSPLWMGHTFLFLCISWGFLCFIKVRHLTIILWSLWKSYSPLPWGLLFYWSLKTVVVHLFSDLPKIIKTIYLVSVVTEPSVPWLLFICSSDIVLVVISLNARSSPGPCKLTLFWSPPSTPVQGCTEPKVQMKA